MIKCTKKSSCVFLCVEVIKKTSDICLFRAGGQQTQVGLYQTEHVFVLKGYLQFLNSGFPESTQLWYLREIYWRKPDDTLRYCPLLAKGEYT